MYNLRQNVSKYYKYRLDTKYLNAFLLIFAVGFVSCNSEKVNKNDLAIHWIPFEWNQSITNGDTLKYSSMLMKSEIKGVGKDLIFQFDMGAANTVIYENNLKGIMNSASSYPFEINKNDSLKWNGRIDGIKIKNIEISANNYELKEIQPILLVSYGDSLSGLETKEIGSLGIDFAMGKYLFIDYKNERIAVLDSLPNDLKSGINFTDFIDLPIPQKVIEITIDGKKTNAIFDTGASSWPILTSKSTFDSILGDTKNIKDSIEVSSWGKKEFFYRAPITSKVLITGKSIGNIDGYFFIDNSQSKQLETNFNISAIVGNTLFLNDIVVLDLKNNRFGIAKESLLTTSVNN